MRKTFKYKLKVNKTQIEQLEYTLDRLRWLYNTALEQRRMLWQQHRKSISLYEQMAQVSDLRKDIPIYTNIHAHLLRDPLKRLDKAYKAFFRNIKEGQKATVKFKGKQHYNSFTYDDGITFNDGVLTLSKLGTFRMFYHRLLEGTIKTVTISRESDGWYACLSVDGIEPQPLPKTEQETGIDVGLESFLTTADGEHVENPRHYRVLEKKLAKAQRIMSRRKQGSQNWKDAKQTVATIGRKIARQRQDFHHKTALNLVQDYDTIYHEKLQVKNMIKNHHLAKSIGDAGWSGFISILEYKALYCGKETLGVPPHYTSQICSECGVIVKKSLSQRQHSCPVCGLSLHRDHNAALNILRVGQSLRGAVAIAP